MSGKYGTSVMYSYPGNTILKFRVTIRVIILLYRVNTWKLFPVSCFSLSGKPVRCALLFYQFFIEFICRGKGQLADNVGIGYELLRPRVNLTALAFDDKHFGADFPLYMELQVRGDAHRREGGYRYPRETGIMMIQERYRAENLHPGNAVR